VLASQFDGQKKNVCQLNDLKFVYIHLHIHIKYDREESRQLPTHEKCEKKGNVRRGKLSSYLGSLKGTLLN